MANLWTPEAERLTPSGTAGTMAGGGAKAILHVTVSPSGGTAFESMRRVLVGNQAEPHYLYDPVTDRLGQFFPLNLSSRSLARGAAAISCNKAGSRVIQIEVVAWPGTATAKTGTTAGGFTAIWKPGPRFRAMIRDIRAHGVPDTFPMGSTNPGCPRDSFTNYQSRAGWYGHCHVPYQEHWDPGVIDRAAFFAAAGTTTTTGDDDMTPAQEAKLDYVTAQLKAVATQNAYLSKQVKAVASLVAAGDATTRTQLQAQIAALGDDLDKLTAP